MNLKGISEMMIGVCFYESLVTPVDTLKTKKMIEMQPYEFLVFISRITHEYFSKAAKGVYHKEMMHVKLEKLLPMWLAPVYQVPAFGFNVEFEYDIKMAKRKRRAERKKAGLSSEEEEGGADDDDDSSDEEEKK